MTRPDLDALSALADNATAGPWDIYRYKHGGGRICIDDDEQKERRRELIADMIGDDPDAIATIYNEGDREFLLASREAIPALIAYARELEGRIEKAPHAASCHSRYAIGFPSREYNPCNCWKSVAVSAGEEEQEWRRVGPAFATSKDAYEWLGTPTEGDTPA